MECVILGLQQLSFLENPTFQKHFKHDNICVKTFMNYMQALTTVAEEKVQNISRSEWNNFRQIDRRVFP